MNIIFSEVDESYIRHKVESGYYSNATEMVRDAVRRLREQDEQFVRLLVALELGERDIAEERTKSYTPQLLEDIKQRALTKARNGEQVKRSDVIPY
jgi:antitoxin ParD1/3/4